MTIAGEGLAEFYIFALGSWSQNIFLSMLVLTRKEERQRRLV